MRVVMMVLLLCGCGGGSAGPVSFDEAGLLGHYRLTSDMPEWVITYVDMFKESGCTKIGSQVFGGKCMTVNASAGTVRPYDVFCAGTQQCIAPATWEHRGGYLFEAKVSATWHGVSVMMTATLERLAQ